ncbi:Na(+)/H(+)-K(+) antiporter GerN [Abditibacteriota bacterium]|nr:Na(+)/H(+)-K(+) antiporter GerN [Abditibacteriota bacterium]
MHANEILWALFWVFVAAQVGAEIAQRLKWPSVVGEIAAGCVVGPSALGLVPWGGHTQEPLTVLSEIGAVLLLFSVGLETRLDDLKKVGKVAFSVGLIGMIIPFIMGGLWAHATGHPWNRSLFIAAAFVATSAGITARVLSELRVLGRIESRVILGAAVIDDIGAMLLLGVVTAIQGGQHGVSIVGLLLVLAQALGFVTLVALVGTRFLNRKSEVLDAPINPLSPLSLALVACLGLAALASSIGLAAIIGAFLGGMAFAETPHRRTLERQIQVLMTFLTPFFFVVTGLQIQLGQLASLATIGTLLFITVLAVVGKWLGGTLGARSLGAKSAAIVGVGMIPRGEVGIIVATLGKSSNPPIFDDQMFALIIAMSLLTSVIAPPILKRQLAGSSPQELEPDEDSELYRVEATGHG